MTEPTTTKTIEHGDASALPDVRWLWRRILVFIVTIACLYLAWLVVEKVADVGALREIARIALMIVALCIFVYVAGATATDVIRLVSAVRTTVKETVTTTPGDR